MKNVISVIFILGLLAGYSGVLYAQSGDEGNIDISSVIDMSELERNGAYTYNPLDRIRKKVQASGIGPDAQIWNKTPWLDPKVNFGPSGSSIFAGDINGDGFDDLIKRATASDERDEGLSATTPKTLVYFGGQGLSVLYDQFFYYAVYPMGDLNGDGFSDALATDNEETVILLLGSANGWVESESTKSDLINETRANSSSFRAFQDLNDDEYEDIAGHYFDSESTSRVYFEILGGESIDNVEINLFPINSENYARDFIGTTFTNDTTLYAFSTNFNDGDGQRVEFFMKDDSSDSLSLLVTVRFVYGQYRFIFLEDYTGDGVPDLLFHASFGEVYIMEGSAEQGELFKVFEGDESSDMLLNINDLNFGAIQLIGDIYGNEGVDLALRSLETTTFISIEKTEEDISYSEFGSIEISSFVEGGRFIYSTPQFPELIGNFRSDSLELLLAVSGEGEYGTLIMQLDSVSDNPVANATFVPLFFNPSDYSRNSILDIFYLGDLEGDGIDNFAIEQVSIDGSSLAIYNGFDESTKTEILTPEEFTVHEVYGGNFLSEEEKSLAVLLRVFADSLEHRIDIYEAGNYDTPVHTISRSDIDPELIRSEALTNLGDINNDGFDDIGIAAPNSNMSEKFFIYLGGTSISTNPDFTIDYSNPLIKGTTSSWGLGTSQGMGDLNGDGIDDFVIGDNRRQFLSDSSANIATGIIYGAVYIHYGQDSDILDFSIPDAVLYPDTSNLDNHQWPFGFSEIASGDFNGDGKTDIAAKAFRHSNNAFDEGVGAIHYFFGDNGFNSSQPDTTIPIKAEYIYETEVPEFYSRFGGRDLMAGISDLDGDGSDELLYIPGNERVNAILYEVGETPQENTVARFSSPNSGLPINPSGSFINHQYRSTVGDFDGDGTLSFVVYQKDGNYRDQPLYKFNLTGVIVSNEEEVSSETPTGFSLSQNYPNPFNPTTNIEFSLAQAGNVKLTVYNVLGQEVAVLLNERRTLGSHTINFDAAQLSSGMYIYRLETGSNVQTRKMLLIK